MIQGNIGATKILLKEIPKKEQKTQAGLVILASKADPQISGTVIQTGTGLPPNFPMEVKIGETCLFFPHSAQRFNIGEEPVLLIDVRDVLFRYFPSQESQII
jgi:co-chaperonin GroES (HSP10)